MQRITQTRTYKANSENMDVDVRDIGTLTFSVKGTYALTLSFFVSDDDGTTWYPFNMTPANSATPASTHSTANQSQVYKADVTPYNKFRVGTTAFTSGTATGIVTGILEQ